MALLLFIALGHSDSKHLFVLVGGPGGEHVVTYGEGVLWILIDQIDLDVFGQVEVPSEQILLLCTILEAIFGDVFHHSGVKFTIVLAEIGHAHG